MFEDPLDCLQRAVEHLSRYGEFVETVVNFRLQMSHPWPNLHHASTELPGPARDIVGATYLEEPSPGVHAVERMIVTGLHVAPRAISQPAVAAGAQAFDRFVSTTTRAEHFTYGAIG